MFRQGMIFLLVVGAGVPAIAQTSTMHSLFQVDVDDVSNQVFYEKPTDIHSVSMNASDTEPARILVYFLKEKGAPITQPAA